MSTIQSVSFSKSKFTLRTAGKWLKAHKLKPIKPPVVESSFIKARIQEPDDFDRFSTKPTKKGVSIVLGFKDKKPPAPPSSPTSPVKKKTNLWLDHVRAFRKDHPDMSYRTALKEAAKTYTKV